MSALKGTAASAAADLILWFLFLTNYRGIKNLSEYIPSFVSTEPEGKKSKVHLFPSTSAAAAVLNTFFCPTHRNRLPSVFSGAAGRYRLTGRVFSLILLRPRRVCPCSSSSSTNCSQFVPFFPFPQETKFCVRILNICRIRQWQAV